MALFGSDIEKRCKKAAADGEPQWVDAGVKVGLEVWRIEKFKVVDWPRSKYGKLHKGDSYIVLNTYVEDPAVNPDKLAWDVHFWIGEESTQDEYGTAACVLRSPSSSHPPSARPGSRAERGAMALIAGTRPSSWTTSSTAPQCSTGRCRGTSPSSSCRTFREA